MSIDDKHYIKEVLKGNKNAFGHLVEKYKDLAFTMAYRIVKKNDLAEDIAQQAFIKAYTKLGSFRMEAKFSSWLYRIVYNSAITELRKIGKETYQEEMQNFEIPENDNDIYIESKSKLVHKAIDNLPYEESTIITLYYFDDISVKEIGSIMKMTESNIKIKLYRARKKLEEYLQNKLEETYI
jgi:RNA polymerase sigma-70 factor, ECF subfamily